jgi:hypothetical protein
MKSRPGDIYRNINRNIGVGKFTRDTIVTQHIPEPKVEPVIEPVIEEPIQEIKPEENELRRTQVEQTTLSSGSQYPRKPSTGDKQDPPRKSRI